MRVVTPRPPLLILFEKKTQATERQLVYQRLMNTRGVSKVAHTFLVRPLDIVFGELLDAPMF